MNVVDSSGWLEYFGGGVNGAFFASAIENTRRLIVPSITIYEVFKRLFRERSEVEALAGVAAMRQGRAVDLDAELALSAARISAQSRLPMADSIVLATARAHGAVLWTQDADFQGLPDVRFKAK